MDCIISIIISIESMHETIPRNLDASKSVQFSTHAIAATPVGFETHKATIYQFLQPKAATDLLLLTHPYMANLQSREWLPKGPQRMCLSPSGMAWERYNMATPRHHEHHSVGNKRRNDLEPLNDINKYDNRTQWQNMTNMVHVCQRIWYKHLRLGWETFRLKESE